MAGVYEGLLLAVQRTYTRNIVPERCGLPLNPGVTQRSLPLAGRCSWCRPTLACRLCRAPNTRAKPSTSLLLPGRLCNDQIASNRVPTRRAAVPQDQRRNALPQGARPPPKQRRSRSPNAEARGGGPGGNGADGAAARGGRRRRRLKNRHRHRRHRHRRRRGRDWIASRGGLKARGAGAEPVPAAVGRVPEPLHGRGRSDLAGTQGEGPL